MSVRTVAITGEIHQIGGSALTAAEDAAVYLVHAAGHAALIDAGTGRAQARLVANIAAAGVRPEEIELLLLTHCHYDHSGGARALRERLGCRVVAHVLDAPFIETGDDVVSAATWYGARLDPCPIDRTITAASETIALGRRAITAVHIPGHSPGSVAYVMESEGEKVVFAQDVHGPLHPSLLSDRDDYHASLQRLVDLDADILCESHFGIIRGRRDVALFIRSFLEVS